MHLYTGREAKVGNFCEWSLTSLAQNRPTAHQKFCLSQWFPTFFSHGPLSNNYQAYTFLSFYDRPQENNLVNYAYFHKC